MSCLIPLSHTDLIKNNRPGHNIRMYWTNFWQPTVHVQKMFLKKLLKFVVHLFTLLLVPFAPKLVNYSRHHKSIKYVWNFTNRCYRNSSKCLKNHCAANNQPIWTQKVPKEAQRCGLQSSTKVFQKTVSFFRRCARLRFSLQYPKETR